MRTVDPTLMADFLEARTARGISIATAGEEIGCGKGALVKAKREGGLVTPAFAARIRAWIDAQPKAPSHEIQGEAWRPVVGWEGVYEVSDHGRVCGVERRVPHPRGFDMIRPRHLLKPGSLRAAGHQLVCLMDARTKRKQSRYVHQLVLEAFVGPKPEGMEGCHYDGDPRNNRLENLRWDTHAGNMQDAVRHGTHPGFKNRKAPNQAVRGSEES